MNRLFSLSACNMSLGLAHLRLTSQMRCSHFAQSVKFSVESITLLPVPLLSLVLYISYFGYGISSSFNASLNLRFVYLFLIRNQNLSSFQINLACNTLDIIYSYFYPVFTVLTGHTVNCKYLLVENFFKPLFYRLIASSSTTATLSLKMLDCCKSSLF